MPMPMPMPTENMDKFMDRCMIDGTMMSDFPDEKQRLAVCNTQWEGKEEKSAKGYELRTFPMELRIIGEEGQEKITGFGAVYNSRSQDLGGFREIIRPGAFKRSLVINQDIKSYFNHEPSKILGRTSAGTLQVKDTESGVYYEVDPPNTTYAKDLKESMKRGDVRHSSFAFLTLEDDWVKEEGVLTRYVKEAEIFELGPVTDPAYLQSRSEIKYRNAKEVYDDHVAELQSQEKKAEEQRKLEEQQQEKKQKQLDKDFRLKELQIKVKE